MHCHQVLGAAVTVHHGLSREVYHFEVYMLDSAGNLQPSAGKAERWLCLRHQVVVTMLSSEGVALLSKLLMILGTNKLFNASVEQVILCL